MNSNWSYSPETPNLVTIDIFSHVTLQFHRWPWKTIMYLFYATSSFVHHFKAIGVTKLKLHSGDIQFRTKLAIFGPVWPWNTLKNRAPLLCCFQPCASFHSHPRTLTGATILKRPIWIKIDNILSRVTLKFEIWFWKITGHLVFAT